MLETLTQQWKSYQLIRLHSAGMTEGKNLSAYDYTLTSGVVSRRKIKSVTHFWISYSYHIFLHNNRNDEAETHACLNETFADLSSLAGVTKNRQDWETWCILIKCDGTSPAKGGNWDFWLKVQMEWIPLDYSHQRSSCFLLHGFNLCRNRCSIYI